MRKFLLPLLAIVGLAFAIYITLQGRKVAPAADPVVNPPGPPYTTFVAGAGLIESNTENIQIGTPVPGIVAEVLVSVGSHVKKGDALFRLDARDLDAELDVQQAAVDAARQRLARAEALPRPEDIPPLQAAVDVAKATLADLQNQYRVATSVQDSRAISEEEVTRRKYAAEAQQARVLQAEAQLNDLLAGTWEPDLAILRADLKAAEARVTQVQIEIDRRTIRATADGTVLQVGVRDGEFAPSGILTNPLILLGNLTPLHLRVDVDENDAWRVKTDAPATAFIRGNSDMSAPLTFVRIEPFVRPKRSLTGDSFERVDTRVLQIIYSFETQGRPIYVGQQMEVYIEAPPISQRQISGAQTHDQEPVP